MGLCHANGLICVVYKICLCNPYKNELICKDTVAGEFEKGFSSN